MVSMKEQMTDQWNKIARQEIDPYVHSQPLVKDQKQHSDGRIIFATSDFGQPGIYIFKK